MATKSKYPDLVVGIHAMSTVFLECRTIGHAWKIVYMGSTAASLDEDLTHRASTHPLKPDGARVLECSRCYTERIDLCVVGYGRKEYAYRLVGRQYRYPDHYKVRGAHQHRELLHEELFARAGRAGTKTLRKAATR
jgi:hypothetical protein